MKNKVSAAIMGDDIRTNSVDLRDTLRSEYLERWSYGHNFTVIEEDKLITELRRQIEIVQDNHSGSRNLIDQLQDPVLVVKIEVVGGLIQ